jgi:hypothetical protein
MRASLEQRFWLRVRKQDGGCWIFNGRPDEYGQLGFERRTHLAHRLSYQMHVGDIPKGLYICHKCDVRGCVNPDHLYAGTHEDNKRDAVDRGRLRKKRGSCHNATPEDFREQIRAEYASGQVSQTYLAKKYGKTQGTISQIVRGYPRNVSDNGGKTRTGFFRRKMEPALYEEIRSAYLAGGVTQTELAARYNCTQTHISRIVTRHRS